MYSSREIEHCAGQAETDSTAPEGATLGRVGTAAHVAEAVAHNRAGSDRDDVGEADAEIDDQPKQNERRRADHGVDGLRQTEIPHGGCPNLIRLRF